MAAKKPVKKAVKKTTGKPPWKEAPTRKAPAALPAKGKAVKKVVAPAKTSATADALLSELFKANAAVRKAAAALDVAKGKEVELREDVQALLGKSKLKSLTHKMGGVTIARTEYAVIEDMGALLAHAKKKGNADLLSVGLNSKAWRARMEAGVEVPGVKKDYRDDLRVTPAKAKSK